MASPKIPRDIRSYLVNTTGLSDVSINTLSPSPINQYAVIEYPGQTNIKTHGSVPKIDMANIQIMARHTSAETAQTNIYAVVDALDGLSDFVVNGVTYLYVTEISRPRVLTHEESGAVVFVWEAAVYARR